MAAAMASDASAFIPANDYLTVAETGELTGLKKQGIYKTVARGRLHPVRLKGLPYMVIFRSEVLAWRRRYQWRPTPQELEVLISAGYAASDFAPAVPGEPATPFELAPGAPGMASGSGALVSPADLTAYVQTVMREGQALTVSAAGVAGEATQGFMRQWAENIAAGVQSPPDMADVADVAGKIVQGVVFPITDTIRATIAPISESLAQAAQARPAPAADEVARQMGVLRVQVAAMLARLLEVFRPMVERLTAREPVTLEDAAPFMQFLGELTDALAGSPFYDMAQSALAQIPATLALMNGERQAQTQTQTPTPAGASSSSKRSTR